MSKFTPEAKVGILTIITVLAGLYFLSNLKLLKKDKGAYYQVSVYFNNVTGLLENADVRLNGIKIGRVADIRLYEGKAAVTLDIISEAEIRRNDILSLSTMGVMGEKYVDIMPGDRTAPLVLDSSTPMEGQSGVGLEELGVSFNVLVKSLQGITDNLKDVTASFSDVLGNSEGKQMLSDILANTRNITNNLSSLTGGDGSELPEIVRNINEITGSLSRSLPSLLHNLENATGITSDIMDQDKQSIQEIISNLEKISENLAVVSQNIAGSTKNIETITDTVSKGEGSVGKLLMEDETINNVNQALVSLQDISNELQTYLSKASSIETYVGYDAEYNQKVEKFKSYVNIKVVPSDDVFYLIQLVNDPYGLETYTTKVLSIESPNGNTEYTHNEKKIEDVLRFSLLYGRRITDFLFLKAGLIESYGGVGADIYLVKDKLSIGVDAWDFSNRDFDPHYKIMLDYRPNDTMFFRVGYDDIINSERRSIVFGAGLSFSDENLKYLLNLMSLGSLAN